MLQVRVAALVLTGLAVAGCSGGSTGVTETNVPTPTAAPASPAPVPAGFETVKGTAYQFGLPTAVNFVPDAPVTTDSGAVERRWRYAIAPNGPFCVVVATEQGSFTGDFPQSVLALFASNQQPGQKTLLNKEMSPAPAGTIGGVDQESTFTGTLDDGTTFPSHLYQRKFLTPGKSLVALTVGGPEDQVAGCRLADIVKTFSATGDEFTGSTPSSGGVVIPSGGSTGGAS